MKGSKSAHGRDQESSGSYSARVGDDHAYTKLDVARFDSAAQINSASRYKVGDLLRVPRTGRRASAGVVVGVQPNGALKVEVHIKAGRAGVKELTPEQVLEMNPLKVGDYVELRGRPFWISGIDRDGELIVLNQSGQRVDPMHLRKELEQWISEGVELTVRLPPMKDLSGDDDPTRTPTHPLPIARPLDKSPYVPIESISEADTLHGLIAGNKETHTVYGLKSPFAGAALHTNRGHNYKDWNEDGGALFADRRGRLYVGVFDQAGGEGSDSKARGAASAIAAQSLFDRMKVVADANGDAATAEEALVAAALEAHEAILLRGHGEVTTFIGAMIDEREAVIVNVGDSGAMHFDAKGRHLESTEEQGIGRILLEGLGKRYPEGQGPDCKRYRWKMTKGEYLVFGTDGLLDAKLKREEIGSIIANAGNAADGTRALRDIVSQRMKTKKGKPDNLTVLVIRVGQD
jgi:serine/threonine protein phosphatase PrpC